MTSSRAPSAPAEEHAVADLDSPQRLRDMKPYVAEIHEAEGSDGSFRIVISNGRIQLADLRAPSRSDAERISAELMRRFHEIERNWPWMRG